MSRPIKQGLDYFPHDTDAVSDEKIEALMALYGCEGYAFYFVLLERIYRTEIGVLPMGKLTDKVGITRKLGISVERFDQILASAIEIGCFDPAVYSQSQELTSEGVRKRIEKILLIRLKERNKKESIKEKEKRKTISGKPRENPRENKKSFIPPKLQDVKDYCLERKNNINAEKWHSYYSSNGWKVGKNKMVDWKAAVRTWEGGNHGASGKDSQPNKLAAEPGKYAGIGEVCGEE